MNPGRRSTANAAPLCPGLLCFTPLAWKTAVQFLILTMGLLFVVVSASDAQTPNIQKEVDKKLEKAASLEQMIQQALKTNPDIRLAEARLREATAERDRARADITARVHVLLADIAAAEVAEKEAQQEFARATKLHKMAVVPEKFSHDAMLARDKAAREAAAKKAQLPILVGKPAADEKGTTPEKLVDAALKIHPDVAVSEAKAAVAEAELSRARLRATAEVTALDAEIQAARFQVKAAEASFERMKRLLASRAMSQEEYDAGVTALEKAKADLAIKEAKLPYLLGKQSAVFNPTIVIDESLLAGKVQVLRAGKLPGAAITDEEFLRRAMLDLYGRTPTVEELKSFLKMPEMDRRAKWIEQQSKAAAVNAPTSFPWSVGHGCILCHQTPMPTNNSNRIDFVFPSYVAHDHALAFSVKRSTRPDSPLTEKLRKDLDAKIRMNVVKMSFKDVLEYLHDAGLQDINFHIRGKGMKDRALDVKLPQAVPVGAVLQFLEDELDVVFVLREYGIVVVAADEKLPPGAMRVIDFWKQGKTPEPTKDPVKEKK